MNKAAKLAVLVFALLPSLLRSAPPGLPPEGQPFENLGFLMMDYLNAKDQKQADASTAILSKQFFIGDNASMALIRRLPIASNAPVFLRKLTVTASNTTVVCSYTYLPFVASLQNQQIVVINNAKFVLTRSCDPTVAPPTSVPRAEMQFEQAVPNGAQALRLVLHQNKTRIVLDEQDILISTAE